MIGYNKLYLCEQEWVAHYQNAVLSDEFLRKFVVKRSKFMGVEVPVLSAFPLPEYNTKARLTFMLRSFAPDLFAKLK